MWDSKQEPLSHFHFTGAAKRYVAQLTYDELDELEAQLNEFHPEPWEDEEIQNWISHNFDSICDDLGLDYDEVMERGS